MLVVLEATLGAYLDTTIPIVFISDTTFHGFRGYLENVSEAFIEMAEQVEQDSIDNADLIIYSSEWAKESAVKIYGAAPAKIAVVEFGANLVNLPAYCPLIDQEQECRMVFIGKNWEKKGGNKVYEAYKILRTQGYPCSLSIIGSVPPVYDPTDEHLRVVSFIDKSKSSDRDLMHAILAYAHFLVLPTTFDCFGIAMCEAAAYGIPVMASDVGGVSQIINKGKNGFLLPVEASATEYAALIRETYSDKMQYLALRDTSRKEFEKRLNWDTWRTKVNILLSKVVSDNAQNPRSRISESVYIPTYVIHLAERTERRIHIEEQFKGRSEFELIWIDAYRHEKGTIGLWKSIQNAVRMAVERDDDVMILCEDDHYFTEHYDKKEFVVHIFEAHKQGAQLLIGGVGGFGAAFPVAFARYWVDWYWSNQFLVIYRAAYRRILEYQFSDNDTADGVLSRILNNKMVIYPMISRQKKFGYSDVTPDNHNNPQHIAYYFDAAAARLKRIKDAYDCFYPGF